MRLQHNIMAKSSYRNYKNNVSALKKNLEKLSSGYKVNRAADDAAGLAISEKMRAQITGEETAQKNARDGISLVQTAEGALTEVHDILDRMVELATQSANGTYDDDTDRYQLQKEMSLLLDEINRIADSSNFNGIPLLDGSMDAGGDTVFTSGSFQINNSTLHPAGLDTGSIELPDVGRTLGTDTVLHTEGARGGDTNAFSIDLENLSLKAGKTIEITFGDVTVTVENSIPEGGTGTAASARDIIAAIENKVKGTNEGNINVIFSGAAAATGSDGSKVLKIGNTEFKLTASGTRLTFTQTSKDAGIEMPREVTVTDPSALKVKGKPNIDTVQKPDTSTPAKYKIDLTSVDVSSPGKVTIALLGEQFDFEISDDDFKNKGNVSIGKLLAERLTKALEDANLAPDPVAGAVTFTNNQDGTITVDFADPGEPEYDLRGISVTTVAYLDGETRTGIDEDVQFTFDVDSWDGEFDGGILTPKTVTVTVDGEEYVFTFVPALTGAKNEIVIHQGDDIKELIQKKLMEVVAEKNKEKRAENKSYNDVNTGSIEFDSNSWTLKYKYIEQEYIGISDGSDGSGGSGGSGGTEKTSEGFTGDYNKSTTVLETRSGSTQDRLASTWFDLSKLADSEGHIAEGTTITIGRDTYTFTYDASKIGKDGYVVLNGGEDPDDLATAAGKLTKAAEHNGTYTVGFDEEYDDGRGRITVTERENQTYFDLTTMEGIEKSLGFKNASTTPASGAKGLTLQIGDTDDVYSKLNVSIKDCHALALGIADISIARQADAAGAVNAIRAAINYVSDVRGTLGAAQNRLDHTINNLSVMAENIQDAESTIRDADIAEEMMAYTKNNILIQSAQAMLAQANQVPQGVLQLLQ